MLKKRLPLSKHQSAITKTFKMRSQFTVELTIIHIICAALNDETNAS